MEKQRAEAHFCTVRTQVEITRSALAPEAVLVSEAVLPQLTIHASGKHASRFREAVACAQAAGSRHSQMARPTVIVWAGQMEQDSCSEGAILGSNGSWWHRGR